MEHDSFYCIQCKQMRLFSRQGINHVLHLLITVLLFGLWLPVWIGLIIANDSRKLFCQTCGYSNTKFHLTHPLETQRRLTAPAVPVNKSNEKLWQYATIGLAAALSLGFLIFSALR
jgi:hypothetical protein